MADTDDIKFENEDKMKERDILLLIAKYLDIINNRLEWLKADTEAINRKLHEET